MAFLERRITKFGSLWNANFFDKTSIPPVAGKDIIWTPRVPVPPATMIAKGLTHVAFNAGGVGGPVPSPNRATFISNPNFIKAAAPGGKPLREFTQAECNNAVDSFLAGRGATIHVLTTGSSEYDDGNLPWAQVTYSNGETSAATAQYHWIDQRFAQKLALHGGHHHGDYDGHGGSANATGDGFEKGGSEVLRQAFLVESSAYDVLHAHSAPGGGNPFFTQDAYTYRDGIVKTYWAGSVDGAKRLYIMMTDMILSRRALTAKGSSRRLLSFAWAGRNEFYNYSMRYRQVTPGGGVVTDDRFPPYSCRAQYIIGYVSLALVEGLFMWEDTGLFGADPNLVAPNDPDNPPYHYSGSGATVVERFDAYQAGRQYPYPISFDSGHNYMLSGAKAYAEASAWASQNIAYAPCRTLGGSYAATGKDYILNCYQQTRPFGFVHAEANRRALFAVDFDRPAGTFREWEWNVGGASVVINMEGQRPYLLLGEV